MVVYTKEVSSVLKSGDSEGPNGKFRLGEWTPEDRRLMGVEMRHRTTGVLRRFTSLRVGSEWWTVRPDMVFKEELLAIGLRSCGRSAGAADVAGLTLVESPELKPLVESVQLFERLLLVLVRELSLLSLLRSLKLELGNGTVASPYSDGTPLATAGLPFTWPISTLLELRKCRWTRYDAAADEAAPSSGSRHGSVNDLLRALSFGTIFSLGRTRVDPRGLD